ncbi:hypothetical protein PHYBLDRAFT_180724 [Phycomyces blakesleeanus NRRL 1555(-)]|uniref:Uncharacterized protein n=1 Tax=Phycomyces blakesleeanus (strain ATCC 8743b / DSM 1359 / FGSC 10004 / NBRC 33097 / NRRL 1555) TaxID=763407 RepID=A0A167N7I0_PHYB8|nr:hypothetical protein PHYBLDRAFT_180724 [Phycomyces blakesleeanus NRRL 1555(-)]OAD75230.1 hypothetical protein PHYBLDRAFT_180724 [Phycomyces blakesleeanus NRRL 1555(-)]|eukprot:XP_018293270.1 hypothetical protein PHYBLDRAFT_180724 [Phycomyces blakesleeanus NRRL 1555(-)]
MSMPTRIARMKKARASKEIDYLHNNINVIDLSCSLITTRSCEITRLHKGDSATVAGVAYYISKDTEMELDIDDSTVDNESIRDSEHTMDAMDVGEVVSYKYGCTFKNREGEAHHKIARAAYRDIVRFVNTIIWDHDEIMLVTVLMSYISPGPESVMVKQLMLCLSKSSIKGHEYDVCPSGCRLYGINDDQESCVDCGEP